MGATAAVVGAVSGGLNIAKSLGIFGGGGGSSIVQPIAAAPPPVTMPTLSDANSAAAMNKSIEDQVQRRGRASTVLTSDQGQGDKLGA